MKVQHRVWRREDATANTQTQHTVTSHDSTHHNVAAQAAATTQASSSVADDHFVSQHLKRPREQLSAVNSACADHVEPPIKRFQHLTGKYSPLPAFHQPCNFHTYKLLD